MCGWVNLFILFDVVRERAEVPSEKCSILFGICIHSTKVMKIVCTKFHVRILVRWVLMRMSAMIVGYSHFILKEIVLVLQIYSRKVLLWLLLYMQIAVYHIQSYPA